MSPVKNLLLDEAAALLSSMNIKWAFCGGYAIDIFLREETRKHGDIDICVFENDRNTIKDHIIACGWDVYEFRGMGRLRKLTVQTPSNPGRNLMCLKAGCKLVDFYPCDEPGLTYYVFHHTGMEKLDYIEFLFNKAEENRFIFNEELGLYRDMDKALLSDGVYCYLAPEIALLYKASNADDENYRHDFEAAFAELNDGQRKWFLNGLDLCYPQGHPWKQK